MVALKGAAIIRDNSIPGSLSLELWAMEEGPWSVVCPLMIVECMSTLATSSCACKFAHGTREGPGGSVAPKGCKKTMFPVAMLNEFANLRMRYSRVEFDEPLRYIYTRNQFSNSNSSCSWSWWIVFTPILIPMINIKLINIASCFTLSGRTYRSKSGSWSWSLIHPKKTRNGVNIHT